MNDAALKIKLRVEYRLGEVLAAMVNDKGSRGQLRGNIVLPQKKTVPKPLTPMQSSRAQQMARLSWKEIEDQCNTQLH